MTGVVATPPQPVRTPTRRPGRSGTAEDVAAVLATYAVLGALGAVVWWALVDPATFTAVGDGNLTMGEGELAKRFNPDGWYAVVGAVLGLVSGTAVTWWRSRDHLLTSGLLVVGAGLAAGVMATVGGLLGADDPRRLASAVEGGTRLSAPLSVDTPVVYLVWPVMVLVGALVVLWSPAPTD